MIDQKIINKYLNEEEWHKETPHTADYCNRPASVQARVQNWIEDTIKEIEGSTREEWPAQLRDPIFAGSELYRKATEYYDVGIRIIDYALSKENRTTYLKQSVRFRLAADHRYYVLQDERARLNDYDHEQVGLLYIKSRLDSGSPEYHAARQAVCHRSLTWFRNDENRSPFAVMVHLAHLRAWHNDRWWLRRVFTLRFWRDGVRRQFGCKTELDYFRADLQHFFQERRLFGSIYAKNNPKPLRRYVGDCLKWLARSHERLWGGCLRLAFTCGQKIIEGMHSVNFLRGSVEVPRRRERRLLNRYFRMAVVAFLLHLGIWTVLTGNEEAWIESGIGMTSAMGDFTVVSPVYFQRLKTLRDKIRENIKVKAPDEKGNQKNKVDQESNDRRVRRDCTDDILEATAERTKVTEDCWIREWSTPNNEKSYEEEMEAFNENVEKALTYLFSIYIFAGTFTFALFQIGKSQSELFTRSVRKSFFAPFGFSFFIFSMSTLAIIWGRIPPDKYIAAMIMYSVLVTIFTAVIAFLWLVKAVRFFDLGLLLRETTKEITSHLRYLSYLRGTLSAVYPYARPNRFGALRQLYLHPNSELLYLMEQFDRIVALSERVRRDVLHIRSLRQLVRAGLQLRVQPPKNRVIFGIVESRNLRELHGDWQDRLKIGSYEPYERDVSLHLDDYRNYNTFFEDWLYDMLARLLRTTTDMSFVGILIQNHRHWLKSELREYREGPRKNPAGRRANSSSLLPDIYAFYIMWARVFLKLACVRRFKGQKDHHKLRVIYEFFLTEFYSEVEPQIFHDFVKSCIATIDRLLIEENNEHLVPVVIMMHELREQKTTRSVVETSPNDPATYTNAYRLLLNSLRQGLPRRVNMLPGIVDHIFTDVKKAENGEGRNRLCAALNEELRTLTSEDTANNDQIQTYGMFLAIFTEICVLEYPADQEFGKISSKHKSKLDKDHIDYKILLRKLRQSPLLASHAEAILAAGN